MEKDKLKDGELISMLRMRGLKPSQVFKAEEVLEDEGFKKKFETELDYRIWLRDQEAEEETNRELEKEIEEEEKLKEENDLIPDDEPEKKDTEKKKDEKKKADEENDLIPDVEPKGDSKGEDDDLIPD